MGRHLGTALRMTILLTVVTGLIYPLVMTGLCQALFPAQANGSMLHADGHVVGSRLIGQEFTAAGYFHPRPSAAGAGYDAMQSGGSNLAPSSEELYERVRAAVTDFRRHNPDVDGPLPADLLTTSGSGLDPDISPAAAEVQAARVAEARGVSREAVMGLIAAHTRRPQFGFLGEPRVNVLELNLALDGAFPRR